MWKYQCKSQFLLLCASFVVGAVISAFTYQSGGQVALDQLSSSLIAQLGDNFHWYFILAGGLAFAGIVNVIILSQFVINQFRIPPLVVFLICMVGFNYVYMVGLYLVIPMMVITLYGWLSLYFSNHQSLKSRHITNDDELVRMFTLHYPLDPSVKALAENCRKTMDKIAWVYTLGLAALFAVVLLIDNTIIVMVTVILYMLCLNFLIRYRAACVVPINALLYNDCNPIACASAIIYFSTRHGRLKLKMQSLMAQCCIYLDDPRLAQDFLITYPRKDPAASLAYWSLMAYVYYLLKDEAGLYRCREEASKVQLRFGRTGVMMRSEELASIDNKINLMNSDFNECKKYYLNRYNNARLNYEKMDAAYYIALISFVQHDYPVAKVYFEKVVQKANTMYFKKKAEGYLDQLNGMAIEETQA